MKLHNLKIGTRLGFGFGMMLLLLSLITLLSINSLRQVNDNVERIVKHHYAKIKLANDIHALISDVIEGVEKMMIVPPAARGELARDLDKMRGEYKEFMAKLENLETGVKGKELITAALASTAADRKSTRLNSSHSDRSRMPSSA